MSEGLPKEQSDDEIHASDFHNFDEMIESLSAWACSELPWLPARRIRSEWERVEPRLERTRHELSRMLVVGVVGGTGTGKSTLVNALAGRDVSSASDVSRPTTTTPIVVIADDVDPSWLPIDAMNARVVRSEAPAVANIILIDCPDPDTQEEIQNPSREEISRPSDANRNRDMLATVLPSCDVLLVVATAQKYRSWIMAQELQSFAPGRPLFFVQTHASRDPDIRDDWQKELESQGFSVPKIFRFDALDAARCSAAGLVPAPGFQQLLTAIGEELVGRAVRRVRRTGALSLASWYISQAVLELDQVRESVNTFADQVNAERMRLEKILSHSIGENLQSNRRAWQRLLTDEVVDRWHGGPFAMFLHVVAAIGSFWSRMRPAGGLIGKLLAGQSSQHVSSKASWQAVEELGLTEADVEQSRSVLAGSAGRAKIVAPMVGRSRLDDTQALETAHTLLERTGRWLAAGIERLVSDRRSRIDGPWIRLVFEVLFSSLIAVVLFRSGWNYFYGHLWEGRSLEGSGFLQESFVWIIVWGLMLRWLLFTWVRSGLSHDITVLTEKISAAHLVDPAIDDFVKAADSIQSYVALGYQLQKDMQSVVEDVSLPTTSLSQMRP